MNQEEQKQLKEVLVRIEEVKTSLNSLLNGSQASVSKISAWASAIQLFEGWGGPGSVVNGVTYPKGTTSFRNNNPGNLRYVSQKLAIGKDANNFAMFRTFDDGMHTLIDMLTRAATGQSIVYSADMMLYNKDFDSNKPRSVLNRAGFFQVYAPTNDGNYPQKYAQFVADKLGVPITTKIGQLV